MERGAASGMLCSAVTRIAHVRSHRRAPCTCPVRRPESQLMPPSVPAPHTHTLTRTASCSARPCPAGVSHPPRHLPSCSYHPDRPFHPTHPHKLTRTASCSARPSTDWSTGASAMVWSPGKRYEDASRCMRATSADKTCRPRRRRKRKKVRCDLHLFGHVSVPRAQLLPLVCVCAVRPCLQGRARRLGGRALSTKEPTLPKARFAWQSPATACRRAAHRPDALEQRAHVVGRVAKQDALQPCMGASRRSNCACQSPRRALHLPQGPPILPPASHHGHSHAW